MKNNPVEELITDVTSELRELYPEDILDSGKILGYTTLEESGLETGFYYNSDDSVFVFYIDNDVTAIAPLEGDDLTEFLKTLSETE